MRYRIYFDYEIQGGNALLGKVTPTLDYNAMTALPVDVIDDTLVMPTEVEGIPVIGCKDFWLMGDSRYPIDVNKLVIPQGYKKLGAKSFSQWDTLETVFLFCDTDAMCEWNFAYCKNLKDVYCADEELLSRCKKLPDAINYKARGCFDSIYSNVTFHKIDMAEYHQFVPMGTLVEEDLYKRIADETKTRFINWLGRDTIDGHEWYRLKRHGFPFELPEKYRMVFTVETVSLKYIDSTELMQKLRERYGLRYPSGQADLREMRQYAWELVMMAAGWEFGG